jgi:integral membrane protein
MKTALAWYRVFATVVGVSIILLVLVGLPLDQLHKLSPGLFPVGSTGQKIGNDLGLVLGTAHGFIYMGFLLIAFALSRFARWSIAFTLVTLLCGTVPFLSFWAELRAIRQVQGLIAASEGSDNPGASSSLVA